MPVFEYNFEKEVLEKHLAAVELCQKNEEYEQSRIRERDARVN